MAVSDVQIAKLALQHIGDRYDITSLDQASTEAEQVNLVYANVRDALLREHPWKFARKYVSPATLSGTAPSGWEYMFAYPSDAMKIIKIIHPLDPRGVKLEPIEFDVALNSTDTKVILTNQQDPEIEYIKKVTVATEFDPLFDWAFSWRLAAAIALPLTGDGAIANNVVSRMMREVDMAKMEDGNEGAAGRQTRDPTWLEARN